MELFTLDNLITLLLLIMLQAVLGFDNLLYISLESKRAPAEKQAMVRRLGIGIAVALRLVLLFLILRLINLFQEPFWEVHSDSLSFSFNLHAVIVLFGGGFILWTAMREIWHMMSIDDLGHGESGGKSAGQVIALIVMMNLVFSFDSILSTIALTDVFPIMATAIITGGILMIWLADRVSDFLQRNRMYEVLGLFILFVVGILLLSEGGHLAHLKIFGNEVVPMTKTTFYFVIACLVLTDVVQTRYQKKLLAQRAAVEARVSEPA